MTDSRAQDDDRFWQQIEGDAKRTILCEPHRLDAVQAAVEQRGFSKTVTVRASPFCPEGKLLVLDDSALEASWRQMIQGFQRDIWGRKP